MTTDVAVRDGNAALLERVLLGGDLSRLSPGDRLAYYRAVCESVGLNPLTRPFDYLTLNGKMVLYAKRDCTDQLRKVHGVSITDLATSKYEDVYVVVAKATDRDGRVDSSTGAVNLAGLRGENLANAMMKAETKAKRRVTLSLCGLGLLDESEIESTAGRPAVVAETGEVVGGDERSVALAEISDLASKLEMTDEQRKNVWIEYVGKGVKPEKADLAVLGDLVHALRKRVHEATEEAGRG